MVVRKLESGFDWSKRAWVVREDEIRVRYPEARDIDVFGVNHPRGVAKRIGAGLDIECEPEASRILTNMA